MHAKSLKNKMLKDERMIGDHVYETVGNLIQQRRSLTEDRLLRSRKLVELMLLRPSTVAIISLWYKQQMKEVVDDMQRPNRQIATHSSV